MRDGRNRGRGARDAEGRRPPAGARRGESGERPRDPAAAARRRGAHRLSQLRRAMGAPAAVTRCVSVAWLWRSPPVVAHDVAHRGRRIRRTRSSTPRWRNWIAVDGAERADPAAGQRFVGRDRRRCYSCGIHGATRALQPGRLGIYYASYNLFIFSMALVHPAVAEPALVWITDRAHRRSPRRCWWPSKHARKALEAAWKYVVLMLMGGGSGPVRVLGALLGRGAGRRRGELQLGRARAPRRPRMPPHPAAHRVRADARSASATKVGFVPMRAHWLPDAHSQAPAPVCALLSGLETTLDRCT